MVERLADADVEGVKMAMVVRWKGDAGLMQVRRGATTIEGVHAGGQTDGSRLLWLKHPRILRLLGDRFPVPAKIVLRLAVTRSRF